MRIGAAMAASAKSARGFSQTMGPSSCGPLERVKNRVFGSVRLQPDPDTVRLKADTTGIFSHAPQDLSSTLPRQEEMTQRAIGRRVGDDQRVAKAFRARAA